MDNVFSYLKKHRYVLGKVLGSGAFAIVYSAKKDGKEYAIRIMKLDKEKEEEYLKKKDEINNQISQKECEFLVFKCKTTCIHENIACSQFPHKIIDDYFVEIMEKYDSDLAKYIFTEEKNENGQIIGLKDINTFYDLSVKDINNVKIFNGIVKSLWLVLDTLHKKDISHGDIKPENILIKLKDNVIVKIALSDFDTLCSSKECDVSSGSTLLYTTYEMQNEMKKDKPISIDIKKRSDIYAMAITILVMWYGFVGFFSNFYDPNKDQFFMGKFQDLFKDNNNEKIILLEKFNRFNKENFTSLYSKYPKNTKELLETCENIQNAINKLTGNKIQTGGKNYKSKYLKYKRKYLELKHIY